MSQNIDKIKEIKDFTNDNSTLLREIINKLNKIIKGKRKIMYSDIINFIVREGIKDNLNIQLIIWCNYKMKCGEIFVEV